jgi:hypothetical protein
MAYIQNAMGIAIQVPDEYANTQYGASRVTGTPNGVGSTGLLSGPLNGMNATGAGSIANGGFGGAGNTSPNIGSSYTPPPAAFSARDLLNNLIKAALGIDGLGDWALGLSNRGASATEIIQSLRYGTDTSAEGKAARDRYLQAFPQMDQFIKDGIFSGENPEAQYIDYRNTAREAAARYGVDATLMNDEKIATYIGNRTSAAELTERMNMAATAASTTPPDMLNTMQEYYNVTPGDLVSFYLDPETTEATLKARYTTAQIGTEALRQDFGINKTEAEQLAMQGLSASEANKAFSTASAQKSFMAGAGETATREDILKNVSGQAEAGKKLERIAKTRTGKFEQGGSYLQDRSGNVGLGSANTQ